MRLSMDPQQSMSVSNFAARFCNELEKKSVVCSPLSAECVLGLTALGSGGDTRAELLKTLGVGDDDDIRSLFGFISSRLLSVQSVKLQLANRVYVTKDGTLKPGIQKDAVEVFGSGLQQVDFMEKEAAADIINNWVADQTSNRIKDVVSPAALDDTRLLLVNAIYFHGYWAMPFERKLTEHRTFHVNNTMNTDIPMMYMKETFRYRHSKELKAKLLQLPYEGHEASMIVVVPDEMEGLRGVLKKLESQDLLAEVAELRSTRVEVIMPKFKVETDINMKELLPKMGIKTIFDKNSSDIRMLTSNERLFVSEALQRAVIEVNEEGTEAVACTMFGIVDICAIMYDEPPTRFVADRPFLYTLLVRRIPVFFGTFHGQ